MRMARLIATVAAAILLGSCLPVATHVPAGTTVGFRPDPALLGTWRAVASDPDAPAYIHILGNDDGTMTAIVITPYKNDPGGDWSVYRLRAAALGENHILNVQEWMINGKSSRGPLAAEHVLLTYRAERPGKVHIYRMDDEAAAAAIRAGEIAGEIEPGKDGDVRITATEPALDRFMGTSRAARLFTKSFVTLTKAE